MKSKIAILSLCSLSFLSANNDSDKKIFETKYQQADSNVRILKNNTFNINEIKKTDLSNNIDTNITKTDIQHNTDIDDYKNQLNSILHNQTYKDRFTNAKKDLLYDIGYKTDDMIQNLQSYRTNSNEILSEKEKIFIIISSSLPKELIKNYFILAKNSPLDFNFVLRGVIGNDISKLVPTLNYFKDLSKISSVGYNLTINPKITQAYNITKVPAIVYIKDFDNILEQHEKYEDKQINSNDDNVFVFYGDMALDYALEQINKKAQSKTLSKLIDKLNKSEFYK